jgi:hypothetical protein
VGVAADVVVGADEGDAVVLVDGEDGFGLDADGVAVFAGALDFEAVFEEVGDRAHAAASDAADSHAWFDSVHRARMICVGVKRMCVRDRRFASHARILHRTNNLECGVIRRVARCGAGLLA